MSMVRAMKASEHTFCYSEGEERDTRYGCIGHIGAVAINGGDFKCQIMVTRVFHRATRMKNGR